MHGAGFVFDAIKTLRNNRSLLKGKDAGHYKNFDTAYITDSIISRKAPVYRQASKQYLAQLRQQLEADSKRSRIKKRILLAITSIMIGLGVYLVFFS
jgi:hypothetical protein